MFNFLKEKLKSALSIFSKKAEEEGIKEEQVIPQEEPAVTKPISSTKIQPQEPIRKAPKQTVDQKKEFEPKKGSPQGSSELSFIKAARQRAEKEREPTPPTKPLFQKPKERKEQASVAPTIPEKKQLTPASTHQEKPVPEQPTSEPLFIEKKPIEPLPDLKHFDEKKEQETPAPPPREPGFLSRMFGKKEEAQQVSTERPSLKAEEPRSEKEVKQQPPSAIEEEAQGFLGKLAQKITTTKITPKQFEDLFITLEMAMLENNVAVDVIEKIKQDLNTKVVDKPIRRGSVEETIHGVLKESIQGLFSTTPIDLIKLSQSKKPLIICLFGINGSGKTTTIAKLAQLFLDAKLEPVIAAADTFRAAAIDQLEEHGQRLGVKVIKHDYGSDAAAVAFDAIKHAESKRKDIVLIDTAGRMQTNANLMDEMKKVIRVAKPDLKIFIGESIAGNDCIEQAKTFNEAIGIDGIILSKADVDEKGGAALSVSYVTGKPILYLGVGQEYKDLTPFSSRIIMDQIGL